MPDENNNEWKYWHRLVVSEIKRLTSNQKDIEEKTASNLVEISKLKIYAIIFGGISGAICAIVLREVVERW